MTTYTLTPSAAPPLLVVRPPTPLLLARIVMRIVYDSFEGRFSDNPRALYERLSPAVPSEHIWWATPGTRLLSPRRHHRADRQPRGRRRALESADLVVANTTPRSSGTSGPGRRTCRPGTAPRSSGSTTTCCSAPPGRLDCARPGRRPLGRAVSPNRAAPSGCAGLQLRRRRSSRPATRATTCCCAPDADARGRGSAPRSGIADGDDRRAVRPHLARRRVLRRRRRHDVDAALDLGGFADRARRRTTCFCCALHDLVDRPARAAGRRAACVDVSATRTSRDLYLAADVLVTDYSSTMFDFAVTGKPMLFYTYDLDRYRDDVRGFYFDLERRARAAARPPPGSCRRAAGPAGVQRRYADRYPRFQRRSAPSRTAGPPTDGAVPQAAGGCARTPRSTPA